MNRLPAKTKGPIRAHSSDQADLNLSRAGKPFGSPRGSTGCHRSSCSAFRLYVNERVYHAPQSGGSSGTVISRSTEESRRTPWRGSKKR